MQKLLLLLLCVCLSEYVPAQSFSIAVSPSYQTITAGDSAYIFVSVTPSGGFNSTVYLNTVGPCTASYGSQYVNAPYATQRVTIHLSSLDTGTFVLTLSGSNMGLVSSATCTIHCTKNLQWKEIAHPFHTASNPNLTTDESGNVVAMTNDAYVPKLYRYLSADWSETSFGTVKNSSEYWNVAYDKKGNVWFGGSSGLSLYDGTFLTQFTSENSNLPSGGVSWCAVDNDGRALARAGSKVVRMDGNGSFTTLGTLSTMYPGSNPKFVVDSSNVIWGIDEGRLFRIDNGGLTYPDAYHIPTLQDLDVAADGSLWMVSNTDTRLYHVNNDSLHTYTVPCDLSTRFRAVCADNRGYVWISTDRGLCQLYQANRTFYNALNSALHDDDLYAMVVDGNGNLWLESRLKLYAYNPDGLSGIPLVVADVAAQDVSSRNSTLVNPNPATNSIVVSNPSQNVQPFVVYDVNGSVVLRDVLKSEELKSIDVSMLESGIYCVGVGEKLTTFVVAR